MDLWFEWDENNEECFSTFDDSDRFDEDSLCSWISEPESVSMNWRGWRRISQNGGSSDLDSEDNVESLVEVCARTVAKSIPFELVERMYPQIPEQMQLRIAFWSFPDGEGDIRVYSCLANGSSEEFSRGEHLVKVKAVKDALQIGFHLSATVHQPHSACQTKGLFNVAITFDRGKITSCNCTCDQSATWCAHIIALCLFRIHYPQSVCLRAPVSEYLSRLRRDQLQKFAQYLISELPQQILPTAQRILDELLSSQESDINSVSGAPDPTAGPAVTDLTRWYLDEAALHDNVKKMLVKFCGPGPLVFSDVNALYYSNTAPPTAAEWSNLLRPLRGRQPEGMWNLLYIVRELFHRRDSNAVNLLVILTEECLNNDQVLIWWFDSRSQASDSTALHNHGNGYRANPSATNTEATKHACAGFCDELVVLWRLAALSPQLTQEERDEMKAQLIIWHQRALEKARAGHGSNGSFTVATSCFCGFYPAIEACSVDWSCIDLELKTTCKPDSDPENTGDMTSVHSEIPEMEKLKISEETAKELDKNSCGDGNENGNKITDVADGELPEKVHIPLHEVEEDMEFLCARAEALHVHGYTSRARKLVILLAEKILSEDSKLDTTISAAKNIDLCNGPSSFTSTTLVKAAFLCGVLAEDPRCQHLAFRVGMFGLEMPRKPARSKALEVKLANQENELVILLKKLPLGMEELGVVRDKAEQLCQGKLRRGDAVLPIMLATFVFETLCIPANTRTAVAKFTELTKENEELGFKAGLFALGMKANVLETQYPILCEGTRRQRGDLALALLLYCRDDQTRLRKVMEVLLDKSRYETPSFVGERTKDATVKQDKENEAENSKPEESTGSIPKNRGGFGQPLRRGSSGRSFSTTSDSGTDSSSSGCGRTRYHGSFPSKSGTSRITFTLTEMPRDDGSGSSSGVDTDSVTLGCSEPSHPPRELSIKVTDVSSRSMLEQSSFVTSTSELPSVAHVSSSSLSTSSEHQADLPAHQRGPSYPDSSDIEVDIEEADGDLCSLPNGSGNQGEHSCHAWDERGQLKAGNLSVSSSTDGDPGVAVCDAADKFLEVFAPETVEKNGDDDNNEIRDIGVIVAHVADDAESTASAVVEPAKKAAELPTVEAGAAAAVGVEIPAAEVEGAATMVLEIPPVGVERAAAMVAEVPPAERGAEVLLEIPPAEAEGAAAVLAEVPVEEAAAVEGAEGGAVGAPEAVAEHNPARNRRRRNRGKGKRKRNKTAVNHATEAEAHFMFELAKTVLDKGGGSSSPSVFSQAVRTTSNLGPNRSLQLCAFEMGLFALGLHNRTSPNWLSRTYSSHVSWISGQAMEIGSMAIQLLLKHWDGNLTPSEVASIADRASRSNDPNMVKSAAELALSCLHMAHTLNPGEILRALTQCREEDVQLLDSGCQAVECAARGGGVYPEVLFEVARHWFYLHEQSQSSSSSRTHKNESRSRISQARTSQSSVPTQSSSVSSLLQQSSFSSPPSYSGVPPPPYTTPEQYVQQQMHHQVQQMMGHYKSHLQYLPYRPANQPIYTYPYCRSSTNFSFSGFTNSPPHFQASGAGASGNQHASRTNSTPQNSQVSYYLNSAYRVGMLALESLSRRTPDDRPNIKFSRNPSCSEDIRWLCSLSAWLGISHLQRFCVAALNAVQSPFVLHDLALDSGRHLARSNPAQLAANLRSPSISPLVQKSLSMYAQCIHYHLINISPSEHEDFVELLRHARGAFCMAPGGMTQFNELLQSIRRGYPKKKELWQMIMTGLAKA